MWERLGRCVATLSRNPHVMKVVLFGSFAEGRSVPGSDIGLSVDLFPYTPDELSNPLAEQALASGKVLFERDSSP